MPQFSWLLWSQARVDLALRLADPNRVFWSDPELKIYIIESLRTWNALTSIWNADYALNLVTPITQNWYNLSSRVGYPRQRTVTDTDIFTIMEYHLLEPPSGSTWTGTPQFSIADLVGALQRRRDEIIQMTATNLNLINVIAVGNNRRGFFPDNVLEPIRMRFLNAVSDSKTTLWRDDNMAFEYFQPGFLQNQPQGRGPEAYSVITGPPLAFDVDFTPPAPGQYETIVLQSGAVLAPPASTILGLPNDWCWVAKWGALADLFNMESEATDPLRAEYCLQRYKDGLALMAASPWITTGTINKVAVDTVALTEMDQYACEWDSNVNAPQCLVTAGQDFLALSPIPTANISAGLNVVGNAPIPTLDTDFVQVSRDTWDVVLDYAQALAMVKQGGAEFMQSKDLLSNFVQRASSENARIGELGLYRDILLAQGQRQSQVQPRFPED